MEHQKRTQMSRSAKKPTLKRKTPKTPSIIIISFLIISIFVVIATIFKITEFVLESTKNTENTISFPKLEISLKDSPIEQINQNPKGTKYQNNTITIVTTQNSDTYEDVEIKGRGNHTWRQVKKPYQIKFPEKTALFNFEKARKWILLANYTDSAYLRNDIAFYISDVLNDEYTPRGNFAELYIDNNYYGLYYLTEKVELDKNRINLQDEKGILVELDDSYGTTETCNYDIKNNCLILKESMDENLSSITTNSFISSFNSLYKSIENQNYSTIAKIIDIDSFAKYFILNEFIANPDAYSSSFFMYKDGDKDKIHAGPGWDFDMSFGNKNWITNEPISTDFYSPLETTAFKTLFASISTDEVSYASTILYDLMDIPEFAQRVKEIYQSTLSGHEEELLDHIRSQADYIRDAAYRDQERWKLKTDFNEEIDYLIDWVSKRYDHFEETYGKNSVNTQNNSGTNSVPSPAPESPQL